MGRARGATLEMNPSVVAEPPPEESGGENAASLFDATSDARVRILRRDESNQRFVTHGYLPPDANEETVNAMFGGGYYKAQLVIPDPTSGRLVIKRARDFKIPGAYKPPQKINTFEDASQNGVSAAQAAAASPALPAGISGGNDLMAVLNAGVVSTLLDLLKTTKEINSRPSQSADPMMLELMKAQAATQAKMIELIMARDEKRGADDGGRKEIMAELLQMKELFAPANGAVPADPMKMFDNMLQTFRSFKDAAEEVSPHTDGGDPLFSSIPKVVEVLVEQHNMSKLAAAGQQQRVARRAVPGPAGGVTQTPEVSTISQPTEELAMWQKILRQQSARLMASAAAKHDPDVIAGTAILFAPPPVLEALKIFFHREEAEITADVLTEVPGMVDHGEWLAEFIVCAQERLFPEEFADDTEDESEGDGADGGT